MNDDDTVFFGVIHVAESYGFLEQIGYFYKSKHWNLQFYQNQTNINHIYQSFCNIMKYFYFQSDNNILEKRNICFKYFKKSIDAYGKFINNLTEGFDYILKIFDLYLNSPYFDNIQKNYINIFKIKIIKRKKIVIDNI